MIGNLNTPKPLADFTEEEVFFKKDRFFEAHLDFEDKTTSKTIVDCAEIVAVEVMVDDRAGDSVIITTKAGSIRLPCASDDVCYTNAEAVEVYELIANKWIAYKLHEKK